MEKAMSQCPDCGIEFKCGVEQSGDDAPCWCMQLPPLPMNGAVKTNGTAKTDGCLCSACLQRRIEGLKK
jgi:hypothetical protein